MYKEYIVVDNDESRKYTLKGTTARVEKELQELGLVADGADADKILTEILGDGNKLLKLCNAIFRGTPFTQNDLLDIDKHAVKEGVLDFFYKDVLLLQTLANSTKISSFAFPSQT